MHLYGWDEKIGCNSYLEELLLMRMSLPLTRAAELVLLHDDWESMAGLLTFLASRLRVPRILRAFVASNLRIPCIFISFSGLQP